MTPIVFINTKDVPFVDLIITGEKRYETRTRNTLGGLVGRRVLIAETGHGKPIVRCEATISMVWRMTKKDKALWDSEIKEESCIPNNSEYDWKPNTTAKYAYLIEDVVPCSPFIPPEGKRHGRVWMEYEYGGSPNWSDEYSMIMWRMNRL